MTAIVVVGAQWGDEGKGKIVDTLAQQAHVVMRFSGGANAGHTLVVQNERFIVRLLPSGVLWPGAKCVLGQGMVIDPEVLLQEIDALAQRKQSVEERLYISSRAHLLLGHHRLIDQLREDSQQGRGNIGTTRRGIGPCYEDKAARRGLLMGDLRRPERLQELLHQQLEGWQPLLRAHHAAIPSVQSLVRDLEPIAQRLVPRLTDTSLLVHQQLQAGRHVLFEGAQGTLLDIDHGSYPYVTSSSAIAGGACTGAGIGPKRIGYVLGVAKAYLTRVGQGPFPTELTGALAEQLRQTGAEYGSVTGRPRRIGWLDLPALRYAARVNGLDGLALTKLDVLTGLSTLRVCVGYETPEGKTEEFPIDWLHIDGAARPIYREIRGWAQMPEARVLEDLPQPARAMIGLIEEFTGLPCVLISVGPSRQALLTVRNPYCPA